MPAYARTSDRLERQRNGYARDFEKSEPISPEESCRRLIRAIRGEKAVVVPHASLRFALVLDKTSPPSTPPKMVNGLHVEFIAPLTGPDYLPGSFAVYQDFRRMLLLSLAGGDEILLQALREKNIGRVVITAQEYVRRGSKNVSNNEFVLS